MSEPEELLADLRRRTVTLLPSTQGVEEEEQEENGDTPPGKDVVIASSPKELAHKWKGRVPDDEQCYWRVSGTPRQTGAGNRIWFASHALGGQVFAYSTITRIEEGRIWFDPVRDFSVVLELDAPTRGFTYIGWEEVNQRIRGGES